MSKYDPLKAFLSRHTEPFIRLHFSEIEAILGFKLPKSAASYDEWWSNNIDGHSHARSWVEAGWRTEEVDRRAKTLAFRRLRTAEGQRKKLVRSDLFGRMKGSVVVKPGVDLTEPTGELWNAERGILHE